MEVQPKEEEGRERGKCRPCVAMYAPLSRAGRMALYGRHVTPPQWQACGAKPPGAVQQFGHTKEFGVAKWVRF